MSSNLKYSLVGDKIDPEIVISVAKDYGICFPESYINYVIVHESAILDDDMFEYSGPNNKTHYSTIYFLPYIEDSYENMASMCNCILEKNPNTIVFGLAGNGDYICFYYGDNPDSCNPQVAIVLHDQFNDNMSNLKYIIAEDFDSFLKLLHDGL